MAEFQKKPIKLPRPPEIAIEELKNSVASSREPSFHGRHKSSLLSDGSSSESFFKKSEFLDPLVRINTLKYMASNDLKVSANVRFALLDLRHLKKPKLTDIFKQVSKKMQQKINIPVIEISTTTKTLPTLSQLCSVLPECI